jgi:hypothetical protein
MYYEQNCGKQHKMLNQKNIKFHVLLVFLETKYTQFFILHVSLNVDLHRILCFLKMGFEFA